MARRYSFLVLVCFAALASHAAAFRHNREPRRVLAASGEPQRAGTLLPKTAAQCVWSDSYPASCTLSYAGLFAQNASVVRTANYAAKALAFIQAAGMHCKTFNQSDCSWPCQWDNLNTCVIADQPRLAVYDCPDSRARLYHTCPQTPRQTKAWCLATSGCTYVPQPTSTPATQGLRACESTYYVNLTQAQRLDFAGPAYYVRMPREDVGCCKGSTYRYRRNNWCNAGKLSASDCGAIAGCRWGSDGSCQVTPAQQAKLLFLTSPRDPLNAALQAMAKECDAITNATVCNAYKPVAIDPYKVMVYLNQNLDLYNYAVSNATCELPSESSSS